MLDVSGDATREGVLATATKRHFRLRCAPDRGRPGATVTVERLEIGDVEEGTGLVLTATFLA